MYIHWIMITYLFLTYSLTVILSIYLSHTDEFLHMENILRMYRYTALLLETLTKKWHVSPLDMHIECKHIFFIIYIFFI